jgi:hypothetical protein
MKLGPTFMLSSYTKNYTIAIPLNTLNCGHNPWVSLCRLHSSNMTQPAPTPDHLIDPRLHRLDSLGRTAKRSRPFENETASTNRHPWRGSSAGPNTPVGLDLGNALQRDTNTRELIALPYFNSSMQEGSEEDSFYESEFDSDYDSDSDSGCSEDDFLDEDTLLSVEDKVSLTDDNNVSELGQSVSQKSIPAALNASVGQVFGSQSSLTFTPEMSREARAAFLLQDVQATPPCKSLKLLVAGQKVLKVLD